MKRILFTLIISFIAVFQTGCDEIASIVESSSGCMLPDAPNYNASALLACTTNCVGDQTGANCCCEEIIYGCTDDTKVNYSEDANASCNDSGTDNDCCIDSVSGCMDQGANNFDPLATENDATTCAYDDYGCMNSTACNYNSSAAKDCSGEEPADASSQNDDCCDLSANDICYLDLNNNGYWEEADSTSASLPTCNCGELGVGWVTGDDVATNMEVQGCTQPTVDGVACIEYNPAANVDNGGCCLTELTDEELANPEIALVGVYNMEITMGMLDENGDCEAFDDNMYGDFGPTINQVTLGAGGGFNHHEEYHDSFSSRPEWVFRAPGIDSDFACEEMADNLGVYDWWCGNNFGGNDFATCDDFYNQGGCESSPGCRWETNFCHPTFSGMPCNDINFAPDFDGMEEEECDMRDDCEWDDSEGKCFTPVWEPWMECVFLDEYECESYGDIDEDGVFEQHCEVPAFDPSEDEWGNEDISCMPNLETYPCFGYDETECMNDDCNWHAGDGMGDPGFCSPPIGNSIGVCQEITDKSDCNAKVGECHWLEHGPNPEDPPFCAPAPPDCFSKNNADECEDSPNCEWDMPDWIESGAEGVCFKDDHCKSNPELNNNEDACNEDPGCEWVWDGVDSGCWEAMMEGDEGSFCECMLPFTQNSCELASGIWECLPWAMDDNGKCEDDDYECMMPMSEQDCYHEFENDDPCADDHSGGNGQTSWDADTHTCTKSFSFSEAGEWSINADLDFCIEWDNEEDDDPDCNTLMTPDECNCFDCMWNGSTGICADWDDGGNGRGSDYFYTQKYENIIEILSNNNAGECFEYDLVGDEIHMTIIHGDGYCEEIILKPATSGT